MANVLQLVIEAKDQASSVIAGINRELAPLDLSLQKIGVTAGIAGAAIVAGLGFALKSAMDDSVSVARLETAMKNAGIASVEASWSVKQFATSLSDLSGISEGTLRDALSVLITSTKDLASAQNLLSLSADIAAGTGMNLESTARMVGQAYAGNWGMLERYIPALKSVATEQEKWAIIQQSFAGMAEATASPLDKLKNKIMELVSAIGTTLLPTVSSIVNAVLPVVESFRQWAEANPQLMTALVMVTAALGAFLTVAGAILTMLPGIIALAGAFGVSIAVIAGPVGIVIGVLIALAAAIALVAANWEKISGWIGNVGTTIGNASRAVGDWLNTPINYGGRYQTGGTVPEPLGSPVPIIAHGGEKFLGAGGGGSSTLNITVQGSVVTERQLATVMREAYLDIKRRNITTGFEAWEF